MKPHLLLSLLLSVFATASHASTSTERDYRLAENGPDRLVQQYQRV
ncbi:hypothetical protein KDX38_11850 [Pseudomonas sp. CDFA 602]|nr:hypothetical protein [Pseudomonas californiensis]MCD5994382.1 hypothetical protein [Pseudomonas californiensis]MCD5999910.1 hypothetical protein [Pseudomonas californiensis]